MTFAAKINRKIVALALAAVALLGGVLADCSSQGGMYQGGSDSAPHYR